MKLWEYVRLHSIRGVCQCGKCFDAPEHPEEHQPNGHTVDLVFFQVANKDAIKEDFEALVQAEYPHWLDGEEHSFLETGADMGDQGIALTTMGLGKLLGVWDLLTPRSILGNFIDDDLAMKMAGQGYITIKKRG